MKERKCNPCGESSPYWKWVESSGKHFKDCETNECKAANPDILEFKEKSYTGMELEAILEILDEGGEQILSDKQKIAFQLVVREGLSYGEAASKMRLKKQTVHEYVKSASKKLYRLTLTKL